MMSDKQTGIATGTLAQVFAAEAAGVPLGAPTKTLVDVPLDQFVPCRWQPRQTFDAAALLELANDIEQHGVLTPPLVWRNEDLEYELIAGERRVRACYALYLAGTSKAVELATWIARLAEQGFARWRTDVRQYLLSHVKVSGAHNAMATIPCREIWGKPAQLHELALVDNLQRADLSALEEARALHDLIQEHNYTQRQLGERLGKSQTWVSQRLNLLGLAPEVAAQVATGELDGATAREIARLEPTVQAAAVAHLKQFGMRSKQAHNLVGKVLDLTDPQTLAGPASAEIGSAERRLAQAGLEMLDAAGRQTAALKLAAADSKGALSIPSESREYRDLIVVTGIAGEATKTRYEVDTNALWTAQAAAIGATCATCQLDACRGLVAGVELVARAQRESFLNDARWPRCAASVTTCQAHTPAAAPLRLPLGWGSSGLAHVTEAERATVTQEKSGWTHTNDPAAWAAILQRRYAAEAQVAAARQEAKANGVVTALTAYIAAQATNDFEAGGFWSQPCSSCVFHKVGADDPTAACKFQANPPAWDSWGVGVIARLWRSGNAPAIGRCRLFRLKSAPVYLPTLTGSGIDLPVSGMLHLLEQHAEVSYNAAGKRLPYWLDCKRTSPWEPPAWGNGEDALRTLLHDLYPGQRLALLLLWRDPFGWSSQMRTVEALAYVPRAGRPLVYSCIQSFPGA